MTDQEFKRLQDYSERKLLGLLSPKESEEFEALLAKQDNDILEIPADMASTKDGHREKIFGKINAELFGKKRKIVFLRWAAAATVLFAITAFLLFYDKGKSELKSTYGLSEKKDTARSG